MIKALLLKKIWLCCTKLEVIICTNKPQCLDDSCKVLFHSSTILQFLQRLVLLCLDFSLKILMVRIKCHIWWALIVCYKKYSRKKGGGTKQVVWSNSSILKVILNKLATQLMFLFLLKTCLKGCSFYEDNVHLSLMSFLMFFLQRECLKPVLKHLLTFTNLLFVSCSCLWRTWSSFVSWSVLKLCHLSVKKVSLLLRFVGPLLWVHLKGDYKISLIAHGRARCELRVRHIPCFMAVDTLLINNWATHQVAYLAVSCSETKQWTL